LTDKNQPLPDSSYPEAISNESLPCSNPYLCAPLIFGPYSIGLTEKHHTFHKENIHITYILADIPRSELKSVEIELVDSFSEQTIALGDGLTMHVKDKTLQVGYFPIQKSTVARLPV
jgi:hypothetical protein